MDESDSSVAAFFTPLARLLNRHTKPADVPSAVNGHAAQAAETAPTAPTKTETIFSEDLTAAQRLGYLQKWMLGQGFRETGMNEVENRLVREAIAVSAHKENAASPRMISYWHPSQPHRAIIFLTHEEPTGLRDISVTLFEQAFKQHLHDAYRQAQPSHIGLATIVEDGNWGRLECMVKKTNVTNIGAAMYDAEEEARQRGMRRSSGPAGAQP